MNDNKFGAKLLGTERLDDQPIAIRVKKGVRERLKAIPNWQNLLRQAIEKIAESP